MDHRNTSAAQVCESEALKNALTALAADYSGACCFINFTGNTMHFPEIFAERYGIPEKIDNLPEGLFRIGKIHEASREAVSELYYNIKTGQKSGSCVFKYTPEDRISIWIKAELHGFGRSDDGQTGAVAVLTEMRSQESAADLNENTETAGNENSFTAASVKKDGKLHTRETFRNEVNSFISSCSEEGKYHALYILDLNGFMDITRNYGNAAGQKVLDSVTDALLSFGHNSVVGKMYGDEFMLFVKNVDSYDSINIAARQISKICSSISINESGTAKVSGCTGIAFSPVHGNDFDTLYKKAELALHSAKRFDRNMYAIYSEEKSSDRRQLSLTDFSEKCAEAVRGGGTWHLYNADIKNFRNINLILGYENGDLILQEVCGMLQEFLKPGEYFTRIFGDNFLLMTRAYDTAAVISRMNEINARLQTLNIRGIGEITFAAGFIAIDDSNRETEFEKLIDCSVIAHEKAKNEKGTSFVRFEPGMGDEEFRKYEILSELPEALKNGQICTFVQPQYDIIKREYVSMEALVRWNHPVRGLLSPDSFIGVCEENGYISRIDFCVLEQMCAMIRGRLDLKLRTLPVAVNQSQFTIHEPGYAERVISLIEKYDIPPEYIELEVTESACVNKLRETVDIINRLREYGFRISMDDFGAGYSTLNLLKDIPVDALKIDKEFLSRNLEETKPAEIIRSIISMAHNINIRVICEGVELEQQVQFLENTGCEIAQGFLFGKPMPYDEVEEFIGFRC